MFPASQQAAKLGIADWRVYLGRFQFVVTGFSESGRPVSGYQVAAFNQVGKTPAHLRVMMLDGSNTSLRTYVGGKRVA